MSHAQRTLLGGNWIELSLKDRYLRKGYYVGVANRSGYQSDSCCHGDACARDNWQCEDIVLLPYVG